MEARVALVPGSDFHIRQGTIALVCTENYVQKTSTQHGTYYSRKKEILFNAVEEFLNDTTVRNGVPRSTDVRLAVPADALPSLSGIKVSHVEPGITWEVTASLDVAGARDIHCNQPVSVMGPSGRMTRGPRPVVAQDQARAVHTYPHGVLGKARSGDTLDGDLRAEMLQDVTAEEIRVALVRAEKFGNEGKNKTVDEVTFERDVSLRPGHSREWRFKLNVGQVAVPSLKTEKSSVRWLVKAWLTRNMRRDLRIEQEVRVHM